MFFLYKDRKKALAAAIALGLLLAALAGVLLPLMTTRAATDYKPVKARVNALHMGAGAGDPPWVEYRYMYGDLTYIVRFEEPARALREGSRVTLYANARQPDQATKNKPAGSDLGVLLWIAIAPLALLFISALVNCIMVYRKEKKDANP